MVSVTKSVDMTLPYGMLLTRLFKHVRVAHPHAFSDDHYLVDHVMIPLSEKRVFRIMPSGKRPRLPTSTPSESSESTSTSSHLYKISQPANDEFSQHLSDDEASNHEDASDTGAAPKQQQQVIPQTTAISNIKLPILKKKEYDIWVMEMEHYLEYIDNDVWKVIQNGNSKKRISTGKDGVIRILPPVTAAEI
ncbi:hypothetical protein Tco_0508812 [Tanacetum coccineum]